MIDAQAVRDARRRIGDSIYTSPCAYSQTISRLARLEVFLKLENLQLTGSFKERGALNKLLTLTESERAGGVIAASAGNHGQALACHAARLGIRSEVVMPESTPLVKVVRTREFGATVVLFGDNYDAAYAEARRRADGGPLTFVHPFDDDAVIAGQGTMGFEILDQVSDVDAIVAPVGGGGLASGLAIAVKDVPRPVRVFGVQAERIPSASRALAAGRPVLVEPARTLAEGIAVRKVGDRTLPHLSLLDEIVTVTEEELASAILLLLEREKTVAEGAGAAALAAVVNGKIPLPEGSRVVVAVTGGNIDVNVMSRIIERGLVQDERLLRLEVMLPDVPGALHGLLGLIAETRANVLQVTHDRTFAGARIGESVVDLTIEARGGEHVARILERLTAGGYTARRAQA